jgi:hypothetical protein
MTNAPEAFQTVNTQPAPATESAKDGIFAAINAVRTTD